MSCKDCKDEQEKKYCNTRWNFIERPNSYDFRVDAQPYKYYWIPVGTAYGTTTKTYYTSLLELSLELAELGNPISTPSYGGSYTYNTTDIYEAIQENYTAKQTDYINSADNHAQIGIVNVNWGVKAQEHPAFLYQQYDTDCRPYGAITEPKWLLKFPICSIKRKFESNETWKLKDCGIWKIEYKLRVRPLVFMRNTDTLCGADFPVGTTMSYETISRYMNFYMSLREQQGSRYIGITPMRIETGIYKQDSLKYEPIVWSDGTYPQVVVNRDFWTSENPNKILKWNESAGSTCTIKKYNVGANVTSNVTVTSNSGTPSEIMYYNGMNGYDLDESFGSILTSGHFGVQSTDFTNPTKLYFHFDSQTGGFDTDVPTDNIFKNKLYNFCQYIDLTGNGVFVGQIEIDIESPNPQFEWTLETRLSYNISTLTIQNGYIELDVDLNPSNPIYSSGNWSETDFYKLQVKPYRYAITIIPKTVCRTITYWNPGNNNENVTVANYTTLSQDFVVELEGFTHVDLDVDKEVSIYLKVLPEHTSSGPLTFESWNGAKNIAGIAGYAGTLYQNGTLHPDSTSPYIANSWVWGQLSVDDRTDFTEQDNIVYEPLLPIRPELYIESELVDASGQSYAHSYRHGLVLNQEINGYYIMIESGWVRAEKVEEECC